MRLAVGCMMHESNTFAEKTTSIEEFDAHWGEDVFLKCDGARHPFSGIVETLRASGAELVPTFYGRAMISGAVQAEAYSTMKQAILERIESAGPLDGICLALHGSMYVEGEDDPEGDLLTAIRGITGPELPIICALDMHATVTDRMMSAANGFAAYRTAPHVDTYETGVRAAELLVDVIREGLDLVTEYVKLPMLLCGEQSETDAVPMKDMIRLIEDTVKSHSEVTNAEFLLGFPWADTPHHGVSAIVVGTRQDRTQLRSTASWLAERFWERRHEFGYTTEAYPLDTCLDYALDSEEYPVLISDTGDNPTAGASEDLTLVLNRLIERGISDALVAVIADSASMSACEAVGPGGTAQLELGKLTRAADAPPLRVAAHVLTIGAGLGVRAAVVDIHGITVIITAKRVAVFDPSFLDQLGIHIGSYKLVIIKSGYMSPEYQRLAARRMFALTPGDTNIDMTSIPYVRLKRPMYPVDSAMHWEAEDTR